MINSKTCQRCLKTRIDNNVSKCDACKTRRIANVVPYTSVDVTKDLKDLIGILSVSNIEITNANKTKGVKAFLVND